MLETHALNWPVPVLFLPFIPFRFHKIPRLRYFCGSTAYEIKHDTSHPSETTAKADVTTKRSETSTNRLFSSGRAGAYYNVNTTCSV